MFLALSIRNLIFYDSVFTPVHILTLVDDELGIEISTLLLVTYSMFHLNFCPIVKEEMPSMYM